MYRFLRTYAILWLLFPNALWGQVTPSPSPANTLSQAWQRHQELLDSSWVKHIPFTNIGPTVFGGRVTDIAVDPSDPAHFYVAYASGGLWETVNHGQSFRPLFDKQAVITIGALAVDWPNSTLWVGTGEVNSSRSSYAGNGLYKSTDNGGSWQHLGLEDTHHIGRVQIHPTDSNTLWVAAMGHLYSPNPKRGIFKTTDGGRHWEKTLYVNDSTGAVDLVLDPTQPDVLYAATWQRLRKAWTFLEGGRGSGIWRSTDGGDRWELISEGESGFPSGPHCGRIGLAISRKGEQSFLYALVDNYERRPPDAEQKETLIVRDFENMSKAEFLELDTAHLSHFLKTEGFPQEYGVERIREMVTSDSIAPVALFTYLHDGNRQLFDTEVVGAELYLSKNGGNSWSRTHEDYLDGVFYSYGYYFAQVRVSPDDPEQVYIMGVPALFSEDGGKTFSSMAAPHVHVDHHALWVNPNRPGHLILGNDGGINISYDNGAHWNKCNTPAVGQFYTVALDRSNPYKVYGGLQDNGTWAGPNNYEHSYRWYASGHYPYREILGGDGMQIAIDTRDNQTVYAGYQFGNYFRIHLPSGKRTQITPRHELGNPPWRWNWQTPIHLSVHNRDILYMGSNVVHRSFDKGSTFEVISPDLTRGGRPGDVPFGTLTSLHESPLQFGLMYAGSDDGLLHRTRDGGISWEPIHQELPRGYWVSRVIASRHKKGRVYVSLNGYREDQFEARLFVSNDFGNQWQSLSGQLPAGPINVVREDPYHADLLYVGSDNGLYVSMDGGTHFMPFDKGLPNVPVHDLAIHPNARELVIATHGRSFYKAPIGVLQSWKNLKERPEVYLFDLPKLNWRSDWGKMGYGWSKAPKPELRIPIFTNLDRKGPLTIWTVNEEGEAAFKVKEWEVALSAGFHFVPWDGVISEASLEALREWSEQEEIEVAEDRQLYVPKGQYLIRWQGQEKTWVVE